MPSKKLSSANEKAATLRDYAQSLQRKALEDPDAAAKWNSMARSAEAAADNLERHGERRTRRK